MVTTVDWNYQIRNRPSGPGGTILVDNYPPTGPYPVTEIVFLNPDGVYVDSDGNVYTSLASLSQQGVIGIAGGQTIQGPFGIAGPGDVAFPDPALGGYPLVLSGTGLGFYTYSEGALTTPQAGIAYIASYPPYPDLDIFTSSYMNISCGTAYYGNLLLLNNSAGSMISMGGAPGSIAIEDPYQVYLAGGPDPLTATAGSAVFGSNLFDIYDALTQPQYSIGQGAYKGQWFTDALGNIYSGGILTTAGATTLGGDLSGTAGSATVTGLQGEPIASGTPAMGDILTWNGSEWISEPPPSPTGTEISQGGGSVQVTTAGGIYGQSATSQRVELASSDGSTTLTIGDSQQFSIANTAGSALGWTTGGGVQAASGSSSIGISTAGQIQLNSGSTPVVLNSPLLWPNTFALDGGGSPFLDPFVLGDVTPSCFLYLDTTYGYLRFGSQDPTYDHITFELPAGGGLYQDTLALSPTQLVPSAGFDNVIALGVSGQRWESLYVGTGGTILDSSLTLTQVSTPATPTGAGTLYVDTSGNLYFLGTSGVPRLLALA